MKEISWYDLLCYSGNGGFDCEIGGIPLDYQHQLNVRSILYWIKVKLKLVLEYLF
jgi:hypothetical protein